jgi:hypothetical protein
MRYKQRGEITDRRLPGLTSVGTSAVQPSMSQMIPLVVTIEIKNTGLKELRPTSHLSPEEAGQAKRNTVATTHDDQTGEHDQQQDHVESYCGEERK